MIIPITREEQFLEAAVADEPLSAEAVTRIEKFLDKIAGGDGEIPTPVTRIEKYLSAIAGENVSVPEPITRKEIFLAKIAGMDVKTPEPVTRIEMILDEWAGGNSGILKTVSGSIISIADALARPAESLVVDVDALQDLHGYDKPWAGGAVKNLFNENAYINLKSDYEYTDSGYNCRAIQLAPNTTYTISQSAGTADSSVVALMNVISHVNQSGFFDLRKASDTKTYTTDESGKLYIGVLSGATDANYNARLALCKIQIELGSSATTYAPYSNICPISGWSDVNIYHEDEYDAGATPAHTIDLNGTRYGGTLDVLTGVLTLTHGYIASYNGEVLPSTWISDRDEYAVGTTPTTGAEVVYELATPTTVQLTPTEIQMLAGNNTLWADSGYSELQYWAEENNA